MEKGEDFGPTNKNLPCNICKDYVKVYHRHFSTQFRRMELQKKNSKTNMFCPVCKKYHHIMMPSSNHRLIVIAGSSTLHNVFLAKTFQSTQHIDILTICGGTISSIMESYKHLYTNFSIPQTVVFVGGLNDISRFSSCSIINKLKGFKNMLRTLNPQNKVFFCGLLRPPKLIVLPGNPPPHINFVDYSRAFELIEEAMIYLNDFNEFFSLRNAGIRSTRQCKGTTAKQSFALQNWRESPIVQNCLHLAEKHRLKAFIRLCIFIRKHLT